MPWTRIVHLYDGRYLVESLKEGNIYSHVVDTLDEAHDLEKQLAK